MRPRPTSWWLAMLRKRRARMVEEKLDLSQPVSFRSYGPKKALSDSRGVSFIEVEESAKPFAATDGTRIVGRTGRRKGNDIAKALVIPFGVIVRNEFPDRSPQMTLAQRDDVAQAFLLNRADEPLSERVQIRTASGQPQKRHARRGQKSLEMLSVQRVDSAVQGTGNRVDEFARDLRHPLPVGPARDACDVNAPRFQLDHE